MLCRVHIRKMWAQGLQSRTRSGAYSPTLHTHPDSSSLSAPAPTAISTPPGLYHRTKGTFSLPTVVYTPRPHSGIDALPSCLQLNVQAHTLSPSEQKHTLTSTRGGKKATLCSKRRQLPDVGKLCSQRLFLSVYLLSLSSPSPSRMAQEREVRGESPPHPLLHV